MRTRSTREPDTVEAVPGYNVTYDDHRTPANNISPIGVVYHGSESVIVDEPKWRRITLPNGTQTLAFKAVTHQKSSGNFAGSKLTYHYPESPAGTVTNLDTRMLIQGGGVPPIGGATDLWGAAFRLLGLNSPKSDPTYGHYARWDKVKPGMETRANLAVFLAELRDIKRMFEILPDRHFHLNDWKQVLRYANNQHLSYNFGWKPFFRDVVNFRKAKESFDMRLRNFLRNENLVVTRSTSDPPIVDSGSATWVTMSNWTQKVFVDWNIQRRSTFQYYYSIPSYSQSELLWRAWADSLGLHLSLKNLWAIVPWSFVVDWFADVSGFLGQADHPWLQPWIDIVQGCSTEKLSVGLRWITTGPSAWGSPVGSVCSCQLDRFTRVVGFPNFQWDSQSLNADKIRLLASLVGSKVL